jgi:formiminotetrahydrofolate cyclodeaminase
MEQQTIGTFLDQLAAKQPAPGGGAAAALHLALGAALTAMVARYTTGPKYAEHSDIIAVIIADADQVRHTALQLAEADAAAFTAVADAYKLPTATDEEKTARRAAIGTALIGAAEPPTSTITAAEQLVDLAERLLPIANHNVITDVAAAAEAIRAAVTTSRVNIEINLGGITDSAAQDRLNRALADVEDLVARTSKLTTTVREAIR